MANVVKLRIKRLAAHRRQGGLCFWCGRSIRGHIREAKDHPEHSFSTVEHLIPRCRGGRNTNENIVSACRKCNNDRGNMPVAMWLALIPERLAVMGTHHHYEVLLSWLRARGIHALEVGHPGNGPDAKSSAASPPQMDTSPAP